MGFLGALDEIGNRFLVGHVDARTGTDASQTGGHRLGAGTVEVGHHHRPRPVGGERLGQRPADAAGASCHHHHLAGELHATTLEPVAAARSVGARR